MVVGRMVVGRMVGVVRTVVVPLVLALVLTGCAVGFPAVVSVGPDASVTGCEQDEAQ